MILQNKFIKTLIILFFLTHNTSCKDNKIKIIKNNKNTNKKIKNLIKAYPDFLKEYKLNNIIWNDDTKMKYNDYNEKKDFNELLNNPDLEDQMKMDYPLNNDLTSVNIKDFDPGRIRYQPFFMKMYGKTKKEVEKNLTKIIWMPRSSNKKILVTTINNVHLKLKAVSDELDNLSEDLKKYVNNPAGTYNWRYISGTKRLSMHSFGIAIDINTENANYWLYSKNKTDVVYKNSIPLEIVKIFEKYGFIWGGKWYHYDTMHFEYRPELLTNKK